MNCALDGKLTPCAFYLLRNGKKYYTTNYTNQKHQKYEKKINSAYYQAVAFIQVQKEAEPIIVKSNIITLDADLNIKREKSINKRTIRLKEWGVNAVRYFTPSDEYLAYRLGLEKKEYKLATNRNGFIVNSIDYQEDGTDNSIVFMGASQIECLYIEEGKRLPDIFQSNISKVLPSSKILNGGYSGATSLHILNSILNKVLCNQPKILYCCLPTNDLYAFRNGGYRNNTKKFSVILPSSTVSAQAPLSKDDWYNQLLEVYSVILQLAKLNDFKVYFLTFAHVDNYDFIYNKNSYSKDVFLKLVKDRKYLNRVFKKVILDLGGDLIDLEKLINYDEKYFYDDVHFNEVGCNYVANILTSKVILDM